MYFAISSNANVLIRTYGPYCSHRLSVRLTHFRLLKELGAAQWWWLRRQCSSCDDEEALNFAAADSFTYTINNKCRDATSVAGTKACLQKRLKNQSNSGGDKMEVRLKLLGAPDVCRQRKGTASQSLRRQGLFHTRSSSRPNKTKASSVHRQA